MVGADLEPVTMGKIDVALIAWIDVVAALGSLQIDIGHVRVLADGLPENIALIVAEIDAVNMAAGVFAGQIRILLGMGLKGQHDRYEEKKANFFHV